MIGGGPFDFSQPSLVIAIEFQTKFDACEYVSLLEYGHVTPVLKQKPNFF